jgi:ATP-dependent Clp protease ATP-binding subunit ClpC
VQRAAKGATPAFLEGKLFVGVDLSMVVAAVQHSARSKQLLSGITAELANAGDGTIFFLDELHALLAAGPEGGAHEITLLLKKGLLSGDVHCIASATPEEYRTALKRARWLERCFLAVEVQPATEADAIRILQAVKTRFEEFHSVQYTEDALTAAVVYSSRYVKDRNLPDKAIDLIDDAGAYVKMKQEKTALPEEVMEIRKRINFIAKRHENAVNNHEFEKARFYSDEERKERENLRELQQKHNIKDTNVGTVTVEHIEEVLARWTGMAVAAIRQGASAPGTETPEPSAEPQRPVRKPKKKKPS